MLLDLLLDLLRVTWIRTNKGLFVTLPVCYPSVRAAGDFSSMVQGIESSHNKFSHAVDTLCLFVNAMTQSKSLYAKDTLDSCSESDADDFLNELIKQNGEDSRFLSAIGCR